MAAVSFWGGTQSDRGLPSWTGAESEKLGTMSGGEVDVGAGEASWNAGC